MRSDDLAERLKRLLVSQAGCRLAADEIHDDTALSGRALGFSSIDVVSLVVRLEDEFGVCFVEDEVGPAFAAFGTLVQVIQAKLAPAWAEGGP